jgi:hypothetical protein
MDCIAAAGMGQYVQRDGSVSKVQLQAAAKAACAELHDEDGLAEVAAAAPVLME